MSALLPIVPQPIEAVIQDFDARSSAFTEIDVKQVLTTARQSLQQLSEAENLGAWAEVLAFSLVGNRAEASPWGTYFAPMASGTDRDGNTVYFPDIAGTPSSVISHWSGRAKSVAHPLLKSRYADLAWEMPTVMGELRRDVEMARLAIDAYLASTSSDIRPQILDRFHAALRTIDLATLIDDQSRIEKARVRLLQLHQEVMAEQKGPWWLAYDRLMDDKRVGLSDAERRQLVGDLERLVLHYGDTSKPATFDPHAVQSAAEKLIRHYNRKGQLDDVRRLHTAIARAFEYFAGLGDAMLASAVLQTAVNSYRAAGMHDDSRRVRILMQDKIAEAHGQAKRVESEIKIPREDMESFLRAVVVDDLGSTFVKIAAQFLPNRADLEKQVQQTLKNAPLMARIPRTIMADDHVAARVGSVEDDPFGRLMQETVLNFALSAIWLDQALRKAIEVHSVTPEHIVGWTNRLTLFDDVTFLLQGVRAWYDGELATAVHLLVPQVERGLRAIVGKMGRPVTKPHRTIRDVSEMVGMGESLYAAEVADGLGPDVTLYFLALYADPRGKNLRNSVAHGMIKPETVSGDLVQLIIHTLLVFGIWQELAAHRR